MNKAILTALSGLALSLPALAAPIPPLPPVDNGLTTTVPHFGVSRIETVSMCLTDAGVQRYQDLITDMHWESFTDCMTNNT